MDTFGERVIDFNKHLRFSGKLPEGFKVLNPFQENPEAVDIMTQFYHKYYNDRLKRRFIVGINPGRLGAGSTGVPFTDTKRLKEVCGIEMNSAKTHEVSAVFVYDMIAAYGGAEAFYRDFYINSPFPLAIVRKKNNSWINANYYDDAALFDAVKEYMIKILKLHIALGLDTSEVYVLGKKNLGFIKKLNQEAGLFENMVVLEHPRYIQQYKFKEKDDYISKYLEIFTKNKK